MTEPFLSDASGLLPGVAMKLNDGRGLVRNSTVMCTCFAEAATMTDNP